MKKIDLGQTVNTVANCGVIVGILLLVVELTQNRDMMRAQTRNDIAQGFQAFNAMWIAYPELQEFTSRANSGEKLPASDAALLGSAIEGALRYWENSHYQYRQGLYDDVEFQRHLRTMEFVISQNSSWIRYFCGRTELYAEPFVREIERMIEDHDMSCSSESPF